MAGRDLSAELFGDSAKPVVGRDFSAELFGKPEEQGFLDRAGAAAKRGFEQLGESASGIALGAKSAVGATEAAGKQAEEIRKEAQAQQGKPAAISWEELEKTYGKEGALAALKKMPAYLAEQILQSAPSMAVPMAVGAGAAAVSGPLAPIVGPAAGIGTYGLQQFGQFMQRQAQEGATGETLAPGKAALAAAATAPIGYFADRLMLGMGKIPEKVLGKQIADELAKRAGKSVAGRIAGGATIGVIAEAPTEVLEQAAERWQAGLPLTGDDAKREYKEAFFGAAAVGGAGGAGSRAIGAAKESLKDKAKRDAEAILAAEKPEKTIAEEIKPVAGEEAPASIEDLERQAGIAKAAEPVTPEVTPPKEEAAPVVAEEPVAAPAAEPAPAPVEAEAPAAPVKAEEPVAPAEAPPVETKAEEPIRQEPEDMRGVPYPRDPEIEAEIKKLTEDQAAAVADREKLEKRTSGTSLMQVLKGMLNDNELSELGGRSRKVGGNPYLNLKASKGRPGSSMEDMVDSGKLDVFLPENMRPDHPDYVNSESAEYIREKLRNNQFYTYDTERAIERINHDVESIERRLEELTSDERVNKELQAAADEQRAAEQAEIVPPEEPGLELEQPTQQAIADQEERKAKAAETDEREQIKKESEAGAGQFELTREEGRQDTTGGLFEQAPEVPAVSAEEERKTSMQGLWKSLSTDVPPFKAKSGSGRTTVIKPKSLGGVVSKEVYDLAGEAVDLGLPPAVLGNIKAAGSTQSDAVAMATNTGLLLIGKQWKSSSKAEKMLAIVHELGHMVDYEGGRISNGAKWKQAHNELKSWYDNSPNKFRHPLAYPFSPQYAGKVRIQMESFAQAFGFYFTSPVDLQKNAPEAYSQIQSIVERIQNESQQARAAGAAKTGTTGIQIQPARAAKGPAVQPEAGKVSTAISATERVEDRTPRQIANVEFLEDIPNERWLQEKINYAQRSPRNDFGVPKMSSVTGRFKSPVMIPVRWFKDVKGQRGEEKNVRQKDLEAIRKIIRETGKFPLNEDGTEYVPYIEIGYDGKPWISEGNHRVMAAIAEGMKYIPVELRYFDGGQRRAGVWSPGNVASITENFEPEINMTQTPEKGRENIFGQNVLGSWTEPTETKLAGEIGKDDIIYSLQDKMIDTKRVIQAITAKSGKILSQWNPYLKEELYHGRTAKQTADFLRTELRPLMEEMQKDDIKIGEFEEYLHNRHAEAYNNQVAKVNPNDPDMQDGGSGIKTEDARKYLANLPADKKAKYESLAKKLDGITKGTRDLLVSSGLESKETIDAWEKAFPDYVPLQREDVDFQYTTRSTGTGQGFDVRGPFSRRAMGSKRNVVDILANVAMQRERAIVKAEKNRVAQATYGLAIQNPNPDFWLAVNPEAEKMPESALEELRALGIDESAIEFLMKEPRQRSVDPKKNEVMNRINSVLRNNDSVLSTRVNGENRYVFFNPNNERSARAAKALKNLDADQLGQVLGTVAKITRWMASVNTQYNPIFGAYNFLRDIQGATLQLSTTPLAGKQKEVMSEVLPSLKSIFKSIRGERKGKDVDPDWEDFQKSGGQTGFRDMYSRSQERAEALQKEFRRMSEGKLKGLGRYALDLLSDYNDTMENAVRLAAYKVALKDGYNKDEAASIAKNLTVNFNRKGQIGTQAGALYAFFNAGIQGTTRLIETLRGPAGKKIIAGGLLWGAMQAALLAMAGFDDEEPPEFVRERNFVIPLGKDENGKGKYLTFPMPLGYHVIPGTSRILTEWAMSGFKKTPERIADLTSMYLDAFNPIGNAGWSVQTIAPTFADPLVALAENKDWTGKPIARKDFSSLDPTPGYTRAKDSASWLSTQMAKFMNYASGGTKYQPGVISPTPDQIDYLIGQATGGLGREALKVMETVEKKYTGEELPPYKVPVVGRFYGETRSAAAEASRFYKNLEHINKLENEIKGRKEHHEPLGDFISENPEARLIKRAHKVYEDIKKLKDRKEKLIERGASKEMVKGVENQITMKMKILNDQVANAQK